jgi:hypothetical protein
MSHLIHSTLNITLRDKLSFIVFGVLIAATFLF